MINIRLYKNQDYEIIKKWWLEVNEIPPSYKMLTEDSTFILENENNLLSCLTIYFTNSKEMAYLENFIKNPNFEKELNKETMNHFVKYVENFAKEKGYKRLICLSFRDKLKQRYQNLGYHKTLDNLSSFVKEL